MQKKKEESKRRAAKAKAAAKPAKQLKLDQVLKRKTGKMTLAKQKPPPLLEDFKKKGKRGKKICPQCEDYVPIHSQFCQVCHHEFHIKHKPRKVKEPSLGQTLYSLDDVQSDGKKFSLVLTANRYYGQLGPKQGKKHQIEEEEETKGQAGEDDIFVEEEQLYPQVSQTQVISPLKINYQNELTIQMRNQAFIKQSIRQDISSRYIESLTKKGQDTEIGSISHIEDFEPYKQSVTIDSSAKILHIKREGQTFPLDKDFQCISFGQDTQVLKIEWLYGGSQAPKSLLAALKRGSEYVLARIDDAPQSKLNYMIKLECSELSDFDTLKRFNLNSEQNKDNSAFAVCVEDGVVKIYNLPSDSDSQFIKIKPIQQLNLGKSVSFNLVRWQPFGEFNHIAVSDLLCNIFIFRDGQHYKTIFNSHSKLITDIQWMFFYEQQIETEYAQQLVLASASMDGYLKIWDIEDSFVPIHDFFSSKKWVYQLMWDASINALFFNSEGKFFPQKILYFQQNRVIQKKFNFFTENVLSSHSFVSQDFIYSIGINGVIYQISKKDICRLLIKQKEKLKNIQVKKVLGLSAASDGTCTNIKISTQPKEDLSEQYLYSDKESAVTGFSVSPDFSNKATPTFALTLRHSNLIFLYRQE